MLRIYILIGLVLTPLSLLVNSIMYDNMNLKSKKFVDERYEELFTSGDLSRILGVLAGFSLRWVVWPINIISNIIFIVKLNTYLKEES